MSLRFSQFQESGWPAVVGALLYNIGAGAFILVLGKTLYDAAQNANGFAGFLVGESVLGIVFSMVAGSLTDAAGSKRVIQWVTIACAVAMVSLAGQGAWLVAGALLVAMTKPFYRAAIFALGPTILAKDDLHRFNLRWSAATQVGQMLGIALGGVLLAWHWPVPAILCLIFLGAFFAVHSQRSFVAVHSNPTPPVRLMTDWLHLLPGILRTPRQLALLMLTGIDFVVIAAFNLLLAPINAQYFDGNPYFLSVADILFSAGILATASLMSRRNVAITTDRQRLIGLSVQVLLFTGWAIFPSPILFLVGSLLLGMGVYLASMANLTELQREAGDGHRGKMGAIRQAASAGMVALLLPLIATSLERSSIMAAIATLGALGAVGLIIEAISIRIRVWPWFNQESEHKML